MTCPRCGKPTQPCTYALDTNGCWLPGCNGHTHTATRSHACSDGTLPGGAT